jgi:23S rRNA (adenine-N6)-dimethyltransferase
VAVRSARAPRPRGRHLLRSARLAELIVSEAKVAAGDLVVDLGAGSGMLTRPLARAGAHVVAVELDARLARDLRRLDGDVEVVEGDALTYTWPSQPFRIVANLPFAHATDILRRVLGEPAVPLVSADVVVQWELACKRCSVWPSTVLGVLWGAWYELGIVRRIEPAAFAPPPSVAAGVLRATRRERPLTAVENAGDFERFVRRSFGATPLRRTLPPRAVRRVTETLGVDPAASGRDLDARGWALLYQSVRRGG